MITLAVLAVSACSGSTEPLAIGQELDGTWLEITNVPNTFRTFSAQVHGATITGSGSYSPATAPPVDFTVTGLIIGSDIDVRFAQDDGTVYHLNAHLASPTMLEGTLSGAGVIVHVTFDKGLAE